MRKNLDTTRKSYTGFEATREMFDALAQIDSKGYLIPYSATVSADGSPKKLYKIGASFDGEKRTIGERIVREG